MRWMRWCGLWVAMVVLVGCAAPQQVPVTLQMHSVSAQAGLIGVAMAPLPKVDTSFPGAGCLLCLGVANANHSSLNKHVGTLKADELASLKDELVARIAAKGGKAVALAQPFRVEALKEFDGKQPNAARRDFRAVAELNGMDKLVLVEWQALGIWRDYSAYVPVAPPRAVVRGRISLIDLKSNTYEWYEPITLDKGALQWDQAPDFPELTNAYYQALELAKDAALRPLK